LPVDFTQFEETVTPIRDLANVHLERRFLTRPGIIEAHRTHGIFLCPTRMDTQGVSRDEAMSSGLVPVTNAVGAVPEFVDSRSAILAPADDAAALAAGIARLYEDPALFASMSRAAAERVRGQSAIGEVIGREISLFTAAGPDVAPDDRSGAVPA
jgi:glycosyltransferase involved in cell wall biosynthesis